jgi:hypothetical protein
LNSCVYFLLGLPMFQTPGAYLLRSMSGKSGQLQQEKVKSFAEVRRKLKI